MTVRRGNQPPQRNMNIQALLDYRCHAPGGVLGQHFPHKFRTCARWLADSTVPAIADRFGFANAEEAAFVQKRARSLMDLGFEGAVKQAQSELVADKSKGNKATIYKWPEPCCNLEEWRGSVNSLIPPFPFPPTRHTYAQ